MLNERKNDQVKVLLLDTSFSAVPIYQYLKSAGFDLWTVGKRPFDPLALADEDHWIEQDYSDIDAIKLLVEQGGFKFVVPGCTDVSMNTFVHLNLATPSRFTVEADAILNKKNLFRELCAELSLPAPHAINFEDLPENGTFICKPIDSFSGQGATVFEAADKDSAKSALKIARTSSPSNTVIIENFVQGQLYSHSAFLKNHKVEVEFVVREGSRYDPVAVDTSYLIDPSDTKFRVDQCLIIRNSIEKIAERLNLSDGLVHTQFIANDTEIAILEITRRCPGDLYSKLIELSTGFPYAAKYASIFVNKKITLSPPKQRHILRFTLKERGSGHFMGIDLSAFEGKIISVTPTLRLGTEIPEGYQRIGLTFWEEINHAGLQSLYETFIRN